MGIVTTNLSDHRTVRNRGKEERRGGLLALLTNRRQLFVGLLASITTGAAAAEPIANAVGDDTDDDEPVLDVLARFADGDFSGYDLSPENCRALLSNFGAEIVRQTKSRETSDSFSDALMNAFQIEARKYADEHKRVKAVKERITVADGELAAELLAIIEGGQ